MCSSFIECVQVYGMDCTLVSHIWGASFHMVPLKGVVSLYRVGGMSIKDGLFFLLSMSVLGLIFSY